MAPVLPQQVLGVTDHPAIVGLLASNLHTPASVTTPGAGIRILSDHSVLPELLGKPLGALAIDHARRIPVVLTARPMNLCKKESQAKSEKTAFSQEKSTKSQGHFLTFP